MPAMIPRIRIHPPLFWAATKNMLPDQIDALWDRLEHFMHWGIPRVCSSMTSLYWNASTMLLKNRRTDIIPGDIGWIRRESDDPECCEPNHSR